MKGAFTVGKIKGIEISVHWTFFVLIGLVFLLNKEPGQGLWNTAFVLTIFLCVVLHELAHALVAKSYGITTKGITLLPIGGIAELNELPQNPKQELAVTLAGPLVNTIIAGIIYLFVRGSIQESLLSSASINHENFLANLFDVNLSLAAFNLLPAFPMDGGRAFRAILSFWIDRLQATRIAAYVGQMMAMLFILLGLLYPMLLLIGIFIFFGAQTERQMAESKFLLSGSTIYDVTMKQYVSFQPTDPLSTAIKTLLTSPHHDFVILGNKKVVGTLTRTDIIRGLSSRGDKVPLAEVMNTNVTAVDHRTSLEDAYNILLKNEGNFILVTKEDQVIGIVDLENILEFIMVKKATV